MTYKSAIEFFKTQYKHICLSNQIKENKLDEKEILLFISQAASGLSFTERLVEKKKTVDLVSGQYEYTQGTGASNIPEDFADILEVKFDEGGTNNFNLTRTSIEEMPEGERQSGKPLLWTIYDGTLILDNTPDASYTSTNGYRLYVYYFKHLLNYTGTAEDTFSDLNFESAAYGGSFLLPVEWDNVVIMKAICNVLPMSMRANYEVLINKEETKVRQASPIYVKTKLKYHIGIRA